MRCINSTLAQLGGALRQARSERGLTQAALGQRLVLAKPTVSTVDDPALAAWQATLSPAAASPPRTPPDSAPPG